MLPRNLQSLVVRTANRNRVLAARRFAHPPPFRIATGSQTLNFHSSSRQQNELPKSPFQTFVDVLKDELRKNRELQENVKQLQGDVDKLQDSEAMKRARAAYERARVCALLSFISLLHPLIFRLLVNLKYQRESSSPRCRWRAQKDGSQGRRCCYRSPQNHGREWSHAGREFEFSLVPSQSHRSFRFLAPLRLSHLPLKSLPSQYERLLHTKLWQRHWSMP